MSPKSEYLIFANENLWISQTLPFKWSRTYVEYPRRWGRFRALTTKSPQSRKVAKCQVANYVQWVWEWSPPQVPVSSAWQP
jgi:hypothetical protein